MSDVISKDQAKQNTPDSVAATGVFGLVWFCSWVAQVLLPHAEQWRTWLPAELLSPAGMTAFIYYVVRKVWPYVQPWLPKLKKAAP